MIPLSLTLRGFLTYRDEEALDFQDVRTAVIVGDNGHGKSALFDAITYALFGKHRGGSGGRYLINQESSEMAVRFELESGGRRYRVDRSLTRSSRRNGQPTAEALGSAFDGTSWQIEARGSDAVDAWVREVLGGMTYEICCQSVLLRQGAHDRFLAAKPTERQQVLNTLLDFAPYRRLQDAARVRKSRAKGEVGALQVRLGDLVSHDAETILRLQGAATGAKQAFDAAQTARDRAVARREATRTYLKKQRRLEELDEALGAKRDLIERAEAIRAGAQRHAALGVALPLLRAALSAETAAGQAEATAAQAHKALEQLDLARRQQETQAAEERRREVGEALDAAEAGLKALQEEWRELRPRGEALSGADAARLEADGYRAEAGQRDGEAAAHTAAAEELARLRGLEAARPWLRQAGRARKAQARSRRDAEAAQRVIKEEEPRGEEDQATVAEAAARLEQVRHQHWAAVGEHERAQARVGGLDEQRGHRHEASREQVCSRCGQAIDLERVSAEMEDLEKQLQEARAAARETDERARAADGAEEQAAEEQRQAEAAQRERTQRVKDARAKLERAGEDLRDAETALDEAGANLLPEMAERLAAEPAYPSQDDGRAVEGALKGLPAARVREQRTGEAERERTRLLDLAGAALRRALDVEAPVPEQERAGVRARWASIDGEMQAAETRRQELTADLETAHKGEKQAHDALADDEKLAVQHAADLRNAQDSARAHREQGTSLLGQVAEDCRPLTMDAEGVQTLAQEHEELAALAKEARALETAQHDVDVLQGKRQGVQGDIEQVPEGDRRTEEAAQAELDAALQALATAQEAGRVAAGELARAQGDAEKAEQMEADLLTAQARAEDAALLETLLGLQHLQGRLVEEARLGITEAANQELDAISRGSLRLEMQRKVGHDPEQAELELLVLDRESVREPIDAAYLSGSQRFRVAVALALGIGQYVGGAARGQRAVIIDEGFGSLDHAGIEAMAEHLRDLSDRLERVILVTHQTGVQKHFADVFVVRKENGTSRVRRQYGAPSALGRTAEREITAAGAGAGAAADRAGDGGSGADEQ